LQIINRAGNNELIVSNLPNAEQIAATYIASERNNGLKPLFFKELSESFYKAERYSEGFYYLLVQRILFGDEKLDKSASMLFFELAYATGLDDEKAKKIFDETKFQVKNVSYNDYIRLANYSIELYDKALEPEIKYLLKVIYDKYGKLPYKFQHWLYLKNIGLTERVMKKIWPDIKDIRDEVYKQESISKRLRMKIYRKGIKHNLKIGAFVEAKTLLSQYKEEKPGIMLYPDLWVKNIRCALKF